VAAVMAFAAVSTVELGPQLFVFGRSLTTRNPPWLPIVLWIA
jgi:hypothetical protein